MPWPVYSETFIRTGVSGVQTLYTVPVGRRAIIKSATFTSTEGVAGMYGVAVDGLWIILDSFQVGIQARLFNFLCVLYPGQGLVTWSENSGIVQTVSGYLMQEAGVIRGAPPRVVEVPYEGLPPTAAPA
jgi:hypothetical protein